MITLRLVRPSDINAIVSLSNRRLWQRHTGYDEWPTDPAKKTNQVPWEKLTLYQRYLNAGVWCDPLLYKNHLNWLTKSGGFALAAEETDGVMKRLVAYCEIWCADEPSPLGKTGSILIMEADTHFAEDPIPKLYAQAKKEIRSRGHSTLAICPFSSRAVTAHLDDRRWELLALNRLYRIPRAKLTRSTLPHQIEEVPRTDATQHELFCLDQAQPPSYLWASFWEEFEVLPEMRGALRRQAARRVYLEYGGQRSTAILWLWSLSDPEDYWRLSIWMPAGKEDDRELLFELTRLAAEIWSSAEFPGFVVSADEENGAFLSNRGFITDEAWPAEPRYYTAL
ncbi:MAG TPA: hypothetical protein VF398_07285 [bacterium]|jgi:hypothetical protein